HCEAIDILIPRRKSVQPKIAMGGEGVDDFPIAAADDHSESGWRRGGKRFLIGQGQNGRFAAESALRHRRNPFHHPSLSEVIVSDEKAARLQHALDLFERLPGEKVTLEPDVGIAAV